MSDNAVSHGSGSAIAMPTAPGAPTVPRPASAGLAEASLVPETGWHVQHLYYRVDRGALASLPEDARARGRDELIAALSRRAPGTIERMQTFAVLGHKADFGVMLAGPDLRAIHGAQMEIEASGLGPALVPTYSFCSLTESPEYMPTVADYGRILRERDHLDPASTLYQTRMAQHAARLDNLSQHRTAPEFPDWPCLCFYPMSKSRIEGPNWYTLPLSVRKELMDDHGKTGMKFAGRINQLITVSTGLDDWEWGVTLWARNPRYLKDIVYTMRFDEVSARYALFGPFYFGYILPPAELLAALRV